MKASFFTPAVAFATVSFFLGELGKFSCYSCTVTVPSFRRPAVGSNFLLILSSESLCFGFKPFWTLLHAHLILLLYLPNHGLP